MYSTVINSADFLITSHRDETVEGFDAFGNDKLENLPKNIDDNFPNLIILVAGRCSIKEIAKVNFEGLDKLQRLYLYHNQIEKISDDTFKHIPAVIHINLCESLSISIEFNENKA